MKYVSKADAHPAASTPMAYLNGDAIPVVNDIPIFVNFEETVNTINMLRVMDSVKIYCPAWDDVYDKETFEMATDASMKMPTKLRQVSLEIGVDGNISERVNSILKKVGLIQFAGNPLIVRSIEACLTS